MLPPAFVTSLFPSELPGPDDLEQRYPQRDLPQGAFVTRFGPSPTGFLHIGGIHVAMIARDLAHNSGGSYFIRIEDTDKVREVPGAMTQFSRAFKYFSIESDEADETSPWGPYEQSKRVELYNVYARELLLRNAAYLCFCTRSELAIMAERQAALKATPGYYGEWARCRHLSAEEVRDRVAQGQAYTLRFRSPEGAADRVEYDDLIRGRIEQVDNRNDIILLKSSDQIPRLPTYHFAHAVDDHLMRVNLVLRGEEWISSVPLHLQLFASLGFQPVAYAHIAPLMKMDGTSRRKLSKRKDPEASVDFYMQAGYPAAAVLHYLRGLANSNLADLSIDEAARTPIRLEKCGVAGPMFDLTKLESVGRDYISTLPIPELCKQLMEWADSYDAELSHVLRAEGSDTLAAIFRAERELLDSSRKDMAKWGDFRRNYELFFGSLFHLATDAGDERFAPLSAEVVRSIAHDFAVSYNHVAEKDAWFAQIRSLGVRHGFAPTVAEFRRAPSEFKGSIRDVSNVIRIALTGATKSTELFLVARVLGKAEVIRRVSAVYGHNS